MLITGQVRGREILLFSGTVKQLALITAIETGVLRGTVTTAVGTRVLKNR